MAKQISPLAGNNIFYLQVSRDSSSKGMKAKRKYVVEKIDFYELFLILHGNSNIFELVLTIKGNYHAD